MAGSRDKDLGDHGAKDGEDLGAKDEVPMHGDMLQAIISHVPLIDLLSALHVSKNWNKAVYSSLRSLNPPKPWLFLHRQGTRSPYTTTTYAYDPRSHVWIEISQPSIKYISALKSSHPNFLYMLSPSKLSFSFDPLNLTWHHVEAPLVWRLDPIVAKLGDSIVVAGGPCDFEDDPLAVEIYDMKTRRWRSCDSMPAILRDTACSLYHSTVATSKKLFVMEKKSGTMLFFDLESSNWSAPHDLPTDPRCFCSVIGYANDRLILVGLIGKVKKVEKVNVWEVGWEDFSCKVVGEMPAELVAKLKNETFGTYSINLYSAGNFVYIHNPEVTEEVVVCELVNGGGCRWGSLRNVMDRDVFTINRLVLSCAEVGIEDLQRAMGLKDRSYNAVNV